MPLFLVFLLCFSLVATPIQAVAYTEENEESGTEDLDEDNVDQSELDETVSNELEVNVPITELEEEMEDNDFSFENKLEDELGLEQEKEEYDSGIEEYDWEEDMEYEDFQVMFDSVTTTHNTITVTWSATQEVDEYLLSLDWGNQIVVPGDTNSYTFTDLIPRESYRIAVGAEVEYWYTYDSIYVTPDWSEEELTPVSLIVMTNDHVSYDDKIRIRGIEESNQGFINDEYLNHTSGQLQLPLGKFEVTLYNSSDRSVSEIQEIEIKAGVDYENNPIQLQFRLKEMREAAEPFQYFISKVTGDSFTITWNEVAKMTGFRVYAYGYTDEEYYEVDSGDIEKAKLEYTLTGLNPNVTYDVDFFTDYLYDLRDGHYFKVKTDGEDMDAPLVNFASEDLHENVAEQLGIYFRNVTEVDMKNLTYLNAQHANIESLQGLQYAKDLSSLSVYYSQLDDISAISQLEKLEDLYLFGNEISDIQALAGLTKLWALNLERNNIHDITSLAKLTNLEWLYLDSNEIDDLTSLAGLTKLETLSLESNVISDITSLANLLDLTDLYLSDNQISQLTSLSGLEKLSILNLDSNEISDLTSLAGLTELSMLQLSYNDISDVTSLAGLTNLYRLSLNNNKISDITSLTGLTNLEGLYLYNNEISVLPDLSGLTKLKDLNLYNNQITDISGLAGLENLEYLDLDYNQITDITVLKELPRLRTVYLYGNDIDDEETIQYLRNQGVSVYYDDSNDWNDWDQDEDYDEEEVIIDLEQVLQSFPVEQGFKVSEDGKSITLDLSKQTNDETFELSPEQTKMLIENKTNVNT